MNQSSFFKSSKCSVFLIKEILKSCENFLKIFTSTTTTTTTTYVKIRIIVQGFNPCCYWLNRFGSDEGVVCQSSPPSTRYNNIIYIYIKKHKTTLKNIIGRNVKPINNNKQVKLIIYYKKFKTIDFIVSNKPTTAQLNPLQKPMTCINLHARSEIVSLILINPLHILVLLQPHSPVDLPVTFLILVLLNNIS